MQIFDVIVIGGSYAGMAGALQLARGRRNVAVIDAGIRRNRFAEHSHGVLGQDGKPPAQIAAEAKAQQEPYRNSEWIGKEKERINITVSTFSCLTSWENDYGYTYIYRITDDKNNVYTWKTSNCLGENSVKSLTGTVNVQLPAASVVAL